MRPFRGSRRSDAAIPRGRSDAALLLGDGDAFAAFYRRHEDAILGYHRRRVPTAELAADLTAETFAAALEGRGGFDPVLGEARGWLFGIARHLLARSLEQGRVDRAARCALGMEPLALDDEAIARIDALDEETALRSLADLPDDQRLAVHGRVLDGATYAELAAALCCSENVVRQRVSRGLRQLRTDLEGQR